MTSPEPKAPEKTRQMSFSILEDGTVRAEFGPGVDPFSFHPAAMPESLYPAALAGGFIARARGYMSRLVGPARKPETLRAALVRAVEDWKQGIWAIERESAPGEVTIDAEAAFVYRQKRAESRGEVFTGTLEQAAADFAALSEDQQKTLKALPRYQLARAEVKARRDAEKAEKLMKKVSQSEEDMAF